MGKMRNLKMVIEYDGGKYKGWQKQKDESLTIKGKIESVLSKMTGEAIQVIGCESTDTGTHAENYIANFHTACEFSIDTILDYLYKFLPEDIVVKSMKDVDERFQAKYNVKSKIYVYKINNNKFRNVFDRKYSYHIDEKLDLEKMRSAAEILVGTYDFQSFTSLKSSAKPTIRTINYINIVEKDGIVEIEINENESLLNMIRIIVGTLIEVGKGKLKVIEVKEILMLKKRSESSPMAQPKGLFLKNVQY
jgi:tRNA pseudouridine38-40 synthase